MSLYRIYKYIETSYHSIISSQQYFFESDYQYRAHIDLCLYNLIEYLLLATIKYG